MASYFQVMVYIASALNLSLAVFIFIVLLRLMKTISQSSGAVGIRSFLIRSMIAAFVFAICTVIAWPINGLLYLPRRPGRPPMGYCITQMIYFSCQMAHYTFVDLFFIWRVNSIFKNSALELPQKIRHAAYAVLVLVILTGISGYGAIQCFDTISLWSQGLLMVSVLAQIGLNLWILSVYVRRLKKLAKFSTKSKYSDTVDEEAEKRKDKLYSLGVQQSLLTAFVTLTLIFLFLVFVLGLSVNVYIVSFSYVLLGFDMTVNSLSVFLSFTAHREYYDRVCGCCHTRCMNLYRPGRLRDWAEETRAKDMGEETLATSKSTDMTSVGSSKSQTK